MLATCLLPLAAPQTPFPLCLERDTSLSFWDGMVSPLAELQVNRLGLANAKCRITLWGIRLEEPGKGGDRMPHMANSIS